MDSPKKYSVDEVLNFTAEDIQRIGVVVIEGWENLEEEKREQCIKYLRDLANGIVQSTPVDAEELEEKLRQISHPTRPSSACSIETLPPPTREEKREEQLPIEREAYRALVDEGGIPSHPVELGFDVLDDPCKYADIKDIVSYWGSRAVSGDKLGFVDQLELWRRFRGYQQSLRRYYMQRGRFPEYQRKVNERRQRNGLEGDAELHHIRDEQSKLATWMEYQDYHLQILERFQDEIKKVQGKLDAAQKSLKDAGIPGFDSVSEPNDFDRILALNFQQGGEESGARRRKKLAERELGVAEIRLRAVPSADFGGTIDRSTWCRLAQEHLKYAREQMDKMGDDWWNPEKSSKWHGTKEELRRAEQALEAARSDDFGETVQTATLLRVISEEVRSAQIRLNEAIKREEEVELRSKVLAPMTDLVLIGRKFGRHKILVEWVERQRQMIISQRTAYPQDPRGDGDRRQITNSRARTLRSHTASEAAQLDRSSNAAGRQTRQRTTTCSVLQPIQPSRISKAVGKKSAVHRRKKIAAGGVPQGPKKATINRHHSRSKRISRLTETTPPPPLHAIHSSRVSKTKRTTRMRAEKLRMRAKESPVRCQNKELRSSVQGQLRRSPRIRRKPERFCPG